MARVAEEAGLTRQALYRSLSKTGNPRLTTLLGVAKSFGLKLSLKCGVTRLALRDDLTSPSASPAWSARRSPDPPATHGADSGRGVPSGRRPRSRARNSAGRG